MPSPETAIAGVKVAAWLLAFYLGIGEYVPDVSLRRAITLLAAILLGLGDQYATENAAFSRYFETAFTYSTIAMGLYITPKVGGAVVNTVKTVGSAMVYYRAGRDLHLAAGRTLTS